MKFKLLTDENLMFIVQNPESYSNFIVVCAMELLEYRMTYGMLGCEFLDNESGCFSKMVKVSVDAKPVPEDITG